MRAHARSLLFVVLAISLGALFGVLLALKWMK
jgi:uncharacterized protein YneF (UPF0154 family)